MNDTDESNKALISDMRDGIGECIEGCRRIANTRPEYGAEIVLAQRHLEDARMRLGCALAMMRGEDPFAYKQPGEKE